MNRSSLASESCRFSFRHQDYLSLGPLASLSSEFHVPGAVHGLTPESLTITRLRPQQTRELQMEGQRTLSRMSKSETPSTRINDIYISSLSIVGFEGFTCNYDLNSGAGERSTSLLQGRDPPSLERSGSVPCLEDIRGDKGRSSIGVSTSCNLHFNNDYVVWVAQVKASKIVAIDGTCTELGQLKFVAADDWNPSDDSPLLLFTKFASRLLSEC